MPDRILATKSGFRRRRREFAEREMNEEQLAGNTIAILGAAKRFRLRDHEP